jgi:hypothetical protein
MYGQIRMSENAKFMCDTYKQWPALNPPLAVRLIDCATKANACMHLCNEQWWSQANEGGCVISIDEGTMLWGGGDGVGNTGETL